VTIPGTDGRAGMLSIIPVSGADGFNLSSLAETVQNALPSYAVPKFIRFKDVFETTGTHKIKKTVLRDEGFDMDNVSDPLFVLLPGNKEYTPLTSDVYKDILDGKHKF
jgi:acyl-CoA synthetase (AMP-forming)/AMP-acid ligase II